MIEYNECLFNLSATWLSLFLPLVFGYEKPMVKYLNIQPNRTKTKDKIFTLKSRTKFWMWFEK